MTLKEEVLKVVRHDDGILKMNLINLVENHKKFCDGDECPVMLMLILQVGEAAGLEFTEEEKRRFM